MYENFLAHYTSPKPGTGISLAELDLPLHPELQQFIVETRGGIFADGLLSICSVREKIPTLGGWEQWLPASARLVGTSALGFMFALADNHFWIIESNNGQIVEVGMSCAEFINRLADADTRENYLKEHYFQRWNNTNGPLENHQVLNPVPALAMGGNLDNLSFSPVRLDVHLSFTAQLFDTGDDTPVEIWPIMEDN